VRTPVTSSNGNDGELGVDDGTSDGTGNFLGTLHTETDVSACQQSYDGIGSQGRTVQENSGPSSNHLLSRCFPGLPLVPLLEPKTHPSKSPTATKAWNLVL